MPSRLIIHSLITGLLFIPLVVLLPSSAAAGDESGSAVYAKTRGIFENPGAEYRGKPFWSWNGKLEKDELIRQIHVLKEMGFGGEYRYAHDEEDAYAAGENYFPPELAARRYYQPVPRGLEKQIADKLDSQRARDAASPRQRYPGAGRPRKA